MTNTTQSRTLHLGQLGTFSVTTSSRPVSWRHANRKGRVFISAPDPSDLGIASTPSTHKSDDGGLNDQAWKAFNKLEVSVMRTFAESAVHGKLRFSRRAGCSSCPCSPGFISDNPALRGLDIWVTAK